VGGIRTAKSSIQNCVGKGFAVGPENSSRSPKAGEGRVSVADIGPLFVSREMRSASNRSKTPGAAPVFLFCRLSLAERFL
jgi:hypothetical protein